MKTIKQILPILALCFYAGCFEVSADNGAAEDTTRKKNKKEKVTFRYPYEIIGTRQRVTLYATMKDNNVIMAIENNGGDSANVKIKVVYSCFEDNVSGVQLRKEIVHTISVPPRTIRSYEKDKTMVAVTCQKQILNWNVESWSVDKYPLVSEK